MSILSRIIFTAAAEKNLEMLEVLLFLLKKMEYTAKKKFDAQYYIETVERLLGYKLPKGYNPTKKE